MCTCPLFGATTQPREALETLLAHAAEWVAQQVRIGLRLRWEHPSQAGEPPFVFAGNPELEATRLPLPSAASHQLAIYTTRFDGMSEAESAPYLEAIYKHCTRPDFCCRLKWRPGDVAIWDNRATLHYATNDYEGARRLLYRTTFAGPPPQ